MKFQCTAGGFRYELFAAGCCASVRQTYRCSYRHREIGETREARIAIPTENAVDFAWPEASARSAGRRSLRNATLRVLPVRPTVDEVGMHASFDASCTNTQPASRVMPMFHQGTDEAAYAQGDLFRRSGVAIESPRTSARRFGKVAFRSYTEPGDTGGQRRHQFLLPSLTLNATPP